MKWQRARQSENVEDRRGMGLGGGAGRLGLGGVAIVVVLALLLGKNPLDLLGLLAQQGDGGVAQTPSTPGAPPANDHTSQFVAAILGSTEDVWGELFRQSGGTYERPELVLFTGAVASACGRATAAVGPFYCPGDRRVYLDASFFDEMSARLGGGGDFADAYVIAHEVGHHVQTLTGVSRTVAALRARGEAMEGDNGISVRQELQADCYAGVWANHSQQARNWLEKGDIEEGMNAASAVGDDRLQRQSQGVVIPDTFTHGSSAQRMRWFRTGLESGRASQCDTFSARTP